MSNRTPSLTNTDGKQLGGMEFAITDDGYRGIGWEYTTTKKEEWDRPKVETAGTAYMLPYSVSQPPAHAGGCVSHGRTLGRHVQIHQVRPTRNTTRAPSEEDFYHSLAVTRKYTFKFQVSGLKMQPCVGRISDRSSLIPTNNVWRTMKIALPFTFLCTFD